MYLKRIVYTTLKEKLQAGKVVILYGPRRVGKTYLLEALKKEYEDTEKVLFLNGESRIVQDAISSRVPEHLRAYIGDASLLLIDEAQKIPSIGLCLKMIVDTMPTVKVLVSGSASFDLAQKVGEPLTGRKKTIRLFTISAREIIEAKDMDYYRSILDRQLIYGGYPELFSIASAKEQQEYMDELVDSALCKDILELERVKSAKKLRDLLVLLAFQIGKEVSLSELGNALDLHKDTVARYLDLFEKAFVVINLRGFSRNLRKEVSKSSRYYFYDTGVRNALIRNFNPLRLRDDVGMLWENYIVLERIKKQQYSGIHANNYFWRTYDQKEIDLVEEREGRLYGYEINWKPHKAKPPKEWKATYSNASYTLIDRDNFLDFIF